MKIHQLTIVTLSVLLFTMPAFAGKPKHKHPAPAQSSPPPAQSTPNVAPDAMPSASLQPFLDAHLDRILDPLDAEGLKHPELITDLGSSLADASAKAAPAKRPAYQAAIDVCGALSNALNERTTALGNLQSLSRNPGYASKKKKHQRGEERARNAGWTNPTFANAQKSQWIQRTVQLRQGIQQLYARERDMERQIPAAMQASAVADARRAAIQRYPDLAVEGSKFNAAFVARYTYYQQQQPSYFQDTAWPLHLADEVAQPTQPK